MTGISEILGALARWGERPDDLLSIPESQSVDFKRQSYRLDVDVQKLEFSKDISGMANGSGGLIVLGIATERDPAVGREVSSELVPLPLGSVNLDQMQSVAREWTYPPVRNLEIREWPGSESFMLVSIFVPAFTETGGLVMIRGSEVGDRVVRRTLAIAVRSDAQVDFYGHPEIYEWIRRGRLSGAAVPSQPLSTPAEAVEAELERVRVVDEEWPVLVLQAWPEQPSRVDRIHDRQGVHGVLLDPPALRPQGFNFTWTARVDHEPDRGGGIRASAGGRESIWVTPAGILTFAGTGGPDLLCWGMQPYSSTMTLVNPTALGELTYEFCRLWQRVAVWLSPAPHQHRFRIGVLETQRQSRTRLAGGLPRQGVPRGLSKVAEAPEKDVIETLDTMAASSDPESVAGLLLRRLYGRFGLGSEEVPFLDVSRGWFDPSRFLELTKS